MSYRYSIPSTEVESDFMNNIDNLAANSKRIWSFTIDSILMNIIYVVILFDQIQLLNTPEEVLAFAKETAWILAVLNVIYHTFFTWQNGQTLGKNIMKIKVVSIETGDGITLTMSLLRALVRVVGESLFYLGFLPAFFSPTRQTLHDRVSRSIIVNA